MTEPSPRPAALERAAAVFDTLVATLARMGILPSVTGDEVTRPAGNRRVGGGAQATQPPLASGHGVGLIFCVSCFTGNLRRLVITP
jgi:hypothetical protein